ncbi:MAG: aldo/keto reductase [Lachnospiraceae bacterium]|nr:aldo/keto reductase [Lachnospiraceae bacterium]
MNYRLDRHGEKISLLGFGCMRFTRNGSSIDIEKAAKEIKLAIDNGVNYFDTAYAYPGSEAALGEIFERLGCRKEVKIATKLPQYLVKNAAQIDKFFNEELSRLRTDYIDYYLMHLITDIAAWEKLVRLGIVDWINEKKALGQIKNIGFSFHGDSENFIKVLDAYDWDFCQIQYNYMDENTQAGRRGLEHAHDKGIPVIIMEPLRGGRLVNLLPESAKKLISENEKGFSAAEWSFRWLMEQEAVSCVLSGMNSQAMIVENVRIASEVQVGEFTDEDFGFIEKIKAEIAKTIKVPCTGCNYCMPCPNHVDIPGTFSCYNSMYSESKSAGRSDYIRITAFNKTRRDASQCIECGKCEMHCPQAIKIREQLKIADKELRPWYIKLTGAVMRLIKFW